MKIYIKKRDLFTLNIVLIYNNIKSTKIFIYLNKLILCRGRVKS